ncbi:TnsA-like heteromeric transposase endonuclease subunit [Streptosporangium sp. NBC_01469]|uniref:TnsA-like heteromeric transposase endonuclease subunit n=1 Tax=Streptosporangium sp. NBC_01469 TaxID=2903898 RepID=UPI002E292423|nr:TnsA-like heteromeric transposase endonuclease subunit [Streptosporangium sp. NBC_01469]
MDGAEVHRPLAVLGADQVIAGKPWREVRSRRGQRHYAGFYWSATTGGFVLYESRLELARLLLADFDSTVVGIAAQPFLLRARIDGQSRRHVPDFLLVHVDHSVTVVNVKPASRLADQKVAEALSWPARLIEDHGWAHEIWTGEGLQVLLANVRFLAAARRAEIVPPETISMVLAALVPGDTIRALTFRLAEFLTPDQIKPAVLRLLWQQRLTTDLAQVLDDDSVLWAAG